MKTLARPSPLRCFVPLLLLVLTGCSGSTAAKESAVGPSSPSPTTSPTVSKPTDGSAPTFRFDNDLLETVVPTAYKQHRLEINYYFISLLNHRSREDPLAGRQVDPESCRTSIQTGGFPAEGMVDFRSDTPAAFGAYSVQTPAGEAYAEAELYELGGAEAERYQRARIKPAPDCETISLQPGSEQASITERSLAEFGPASRYIVRSYPRAGKTWTERILMFHTATYASEVRIFGPLGTESDFLTFARLVRNRAKGKLG